MDPFSLFPEEIWLIILDNVEDSQAVWNLFRAFPQLDNNSTLQKKKHLWLFGLVIPHLVPWKRINWITEKELLKCRMACRHWSTAVDSFLENQHQLKAYRPEEVREPGKLYWNMKPYFDKIDVYGYEDEEDGDFDYNNRPRRVPHFSGTYLDFPDDGEEGRKPCWPPMFLEDMENHPSRRSPFLSRSLSVCLPYSAGGSDAKQIKQVREFWDALVSIHRKFGGHVWNYDVEIPVHKDHQVPIPQRISECLSQLPNLRWLSISAEEGWPEHTEEDLDELMASFERGLPPLPNLETLRIHAPFERIGHPLITRFSGQIRRLEISVLLWRNEYRQIFPNLTELRVVVRSTEQVAILKDLLMSLETPQLARFLLNAREFRADSGRGRMTEFNCPLVMEDDVFQWLKRFPNLIYLDLGEECELLQLEERGTLSPDVDSVRSIQFLSIRTSLGLSYNFLRCLPSLQHLHLYVIREPGVHDNSGNPGGLRIREEILHADMLQSNVWELLPRLRTVTLVLDKSIGDECLLELQGSWSFNREEYDYARREGHLDDDELKPLREDIEMYAYYKGSGWDVY